MIFNDLSCHTQFFQKSIYSFTAKLNLVNPWDHSPFSYLRMIWIKFTSQHETQKNCVLSFLCSSTEMFSFLDGWRKDIKGKLHILFYSTPFLATTAAPFSCQRHLFQLAIDKLDNYAEHVFKVSIWELKKIESNINFF